MSNLDREWLLSDCYVAMYTDDEGINWVLEPCRTYKGAQLVIADHKSLGMPWENDDIEYRIVSMTRGEYCNKIRKLQLIVDMAYNGLS